MANVAFCRPEPVYIITESVEDKGGLGPATLDVAKLTGVVRKVVQACIPQDYVVDGKVRRGEPTNWEYIKSLLGLAKIEGRDKEGGLAIPLLVYAGFRNFGEVLGVVERRAIWTPKIFHYGRDPVASVKLYGNPNINFYSVGGKASPSVIVIYDPNNKSNPITQVPPSDVNQLENMLNQRVMRYRSK
jgi:hypothetical protein